MTVKENIRSESEIANTTLYGNQYSIGLNLLEMFIGEECDQICTREIEEKNNVPVSYSITVIGMMSGREITITISKEEKQGYQKFEDFADTERFTGSESDYFNWVLAYIISFIIGKNIDNPLKAYPFYFIEY